MVEGQTQRPYQYVIAESGEIETVDFQKKFRKVQEIHLQMDNQVALTFLLKVRGDSQEETFGFDQRYLELSTI